MNAQNNNNAGQATLLGLPKSFYYLFLTFLVGYLFVLLYVWMDRNHPGWLMDEECYSTYMQSGLSKRAGDACMTGTGFLMVMGLLGFGGAGVVSLFAFIANAVSFVQERFVVPPQKVH